MGRIAEEEREKLYVRLDKKRTDILRLTAEILYPKTENVYAQMKLKPV